MRHRLTAATAAAIGLLLLAGCTSEPKPRPTTEPTVSISPTPTPTPTGFPSPEAAFDVTCDDVAAALAEIIGEPSAPMVPALSTISTMNWIPGPAQYMFQRAGGIGCSAGTEARHWEVQMVPGAQKVIAGATERQGYWGEQARCEDGRCIFEFPVGQVLLSASIVDPGLGGADTGALEEALRALAGEAAESTRDVDGIDSVLVGMPCERLVTGRELSEYFGADVELFTDYGGWGIPSEVYQVVNGSQHCLYTSPGGGYEVVSYLGITILPAGAWAFERQQGEQVAVEGADDAVLSIGEYGEQQLDVRVDVDWIRVTTYPESSGEADPAPLAARIVRNLTVGHPAPQ